jgi:hypothetical protein
MAARPAFLITIDTEGDAIWSRPKQITVRNAGFLPRFQSLCERHGFRPTYLTNYEMAESPAFQEFGRDLLRRGAGEIGMHLHAWNSPPLYDLTGDDFHHQPFLIEYPTAVMERKVAHLTALLADRFGTRMTSHRAGRWATDARYMSLLLKYGYEVDCSVTPRVSWRQTLGDPRAAGGTDYRPFPARAYFIDPAAPQRPGSSSLLELPVTVDVAYPLLDALARTPLGAIAPLARLAARRRWLRPSGANPQQLLRLVSRHVRLGTPYIEFVLHSSEFMPGGSPVFPTTESIERLYEHLESLFAAIAPHFRGATLAEYAAGVRAGDYPALRCPAAEVLDQTRHC